VSRRAVIVVLAAVALAAIAVVAQARLTAPIVTNSDLAVTELYTEVAARGQLLAGPYSRFGWNHPGPMYFYVLAPLYAAGGHQATSLFATAVAINLAALLTLLWVMAREDRGPYLLFASAACLVIAWRVPRLLASPWTAHVPVFVALAFIIVCGAVVSGRHRLLPLLILLGSFIAQTHVSYVPLVGVLSTAAIIAVLAQRREHATPVIAASAGVGLLLWLPTLIDAISNAGGNIAALWRFFVVNGGASHSLADSFANWGYGLAGILRGDLALPWGGHFVLQPSWWVGSLAVGQVALLALVSWRACLQRRRFEAGLAGCASLASVVGLWALTRVRGDFLDHELLWLVALGALNLGILASALVDRAWPTALRGRVAVVSCAMALMGVAERGVSHLQEFTSSERRRSDTARIPATYQVLREVFDRNAIVRPHFQLDADAWSDSAGIFLRLLQDGRAFSVDSTNAPMFATMFRSVGAEDALVNISSREGTHLEIAARPGNVIVRDRHPLFVDVVLVPRR